MAVINKEYLDSLAIEELHELYWDWYKMVENVRPRWTDPSDRESMMSWMLYQLTPEAIAAYEQQVREDQEYIEECERQEKMQREIDAAWQLHLQPLPYEEYDVA